jgi:predicted NBD/HSP70 family sugar kinase
VLTGTNLVYTKKFNLRVVHEVIRVYGPLSRADIARHTKLTGQTVSNLVRELLDHRLVREGARRSEGRGAPSTTLSLNPDGAYAVGLDLDRDHLTAVLVDLAGNVRHRIHTELDAPSPTDTLDLMTDTVATLVKRQRIRRDQVAGLGVGVPGPMHQTSDRTGYLVNPKAFPGWHDIPLASWLREKLRMPVFLENNATAAAAGEHWYGAGQQIGTFFYIYFGSGLGGGMVMDGRPYDGFTGNAGEIGFLPTVLAGSGASTNSGPPSNMGEHFTMSRLYEELRRDGAEARTLDDLDVLLVAGHPRLLRWMDSSADHLTGLVLAIEYLLDPEAICFGGRLSDRVLGGLMDRVARQLPMRRVGGKLTAPHHLLATAGVDAAALGVATLPMYEIFAPAPQVLLKQRRNPRTAGAAMPKAVGTQQT